jgi:type IV secretion system protein VirB9
MKKTIIATLLASSMLSGLVFAEATSFPLPTDNKLVQFAFDKYETYTILTQALRVTDLEFGTDEVVVGKAVSDPILWKVEDAGDRHVLIRPSKADQETSLTVFTDKRTYQFTLRSSPEGGKWYQHVEWSHPDRVMKDRYYAEKKLKDESAKQDALNKTVAVSNVSLEDYYSDYKITGSDEIRPVMVADDGKRTWLKFNGSQSMPAVFIKGNDAKYAMVNYDVSPDSKTIIVQRVVDQLILKLGKHEVTINRATPAIK